MSTKGEMIGKRFGKWTVLQEHPERTKDGRILYVCRCDCGAEEMVLGSYLRNGKTVSCGCYVPVPAPMEHKRMDSKARAEGFRDHLYSRWHTFSARKQPICREWNVFQNFYNWAIESGYQVGAKLHRYNKNEPYSPDNCVWCMMIPKDKKFSEQENTDFVKKWNETVNLFRVAAGLEPFPVPEV